MTERHELIVVGAGPCGIAVGAAARKEGVSCVLFDKGCITSSLVSYPYYMTFFSTAVMLEVGDVPFTIPDAKPTRREALAYYRRVVGHLPGKLVTPSRLAPIPANRDQVLRMARERNPAVLTAVFTELAARDNVDLITGELLPSISISGSLNRNFDTSQVTTRSDGAPRSPDLVDRDFTAAAPNQLWVTDVACRPGRGSPMWRSSSTCTRG